MTSSKCITGSVITKLDMVVGGNRGQPGEEEREKAGEEKGGGMGRGAQSLDSDLDSSFSSVIYKLAEPRPCFQFL